MSRPDVPLSLRAVLAPGLSAIRRYWRPFLLLQGTALLLVVGYRLSPAVRDACEHLSALKQHAGLPFSALSAAVAGSLLPELAKGAMLGDRQVTSRRLRDAGFAAFAFGLSGVVTDLQYQGMAWLFGHGVGWATVLKKMLFDQFVTTPLYGTPYWVVIYAWRANRYRPLVTARQLTPSWYLRVVTPLLVTGWAFWIPMCLLIYAMPGPLQFCLFCVALAAWSLLMVFVATRRAQSPTGAA